MSEIYFIFYIPFLLACHVLKLDRLLLGAYLDGLPSCKKNDKNGLDASRAL